MLRSTLLFPMDFLRLPPPLRRALLQRPCLTQAVRRLSSGPFTPLLSDDEPPPAPPKTPPPPAPKLDNTSNDLLALSPSTLNSYTVSHPPDATNIKTAASFFQRTKPTLLFSTPHFRSFPPSSFPEVAFLGRSNVGKSSLLNALFGRPNERIAHVSKRPGKTVTMNGYGVGGSGMIGEKAKSLKRDAKGDIIREERQETWKRFGRGGMVVVDMPGYGTGSREKWGAEIMKYLENRKQLRRTYVLVDCEHGLKASDVQLLVHLRRHGIAHQVVLSKVDKILYPHSKAPGALRVHNGLVKVRRVQEEMRRKLDEAAADKGGRKGVMGDILCCSSEKSLDLKSRNRRIGVDELRWSALTACGLESEVSVA